MDWRNVQTPELDSGIPYDRRCEREFPATEKRGDLHGIVGT
jgi:hypothetical protein